MRTKRDRSLVRWNDLLAFLEIDMDMVKGDFE
jgi:hypothetical protein